MTYKRNLNKWLIQFLIVAIAILSITACERLSEDPSNKDEMKTKTLYKKPRGSKHHGLWERLRKNFNITPRHHHHYRKHAEEHSRIQHFVDQYEGNEKQMTKISKASPYLHFIVEELEKRNMPGELALLPMIESSFEPHATSNKGAAGLWQFMGRTGKEYGLKQDKWYDGRRDITASTRAALDYLKFLHEEFGGNWMLALAAYNAGPGTVNRAIQRNLREGKPTNFWDLKLPKETKLYVPKFLALVEIIKNPEKYDLSLPHIEDKPYFVPVNPNKYLSFTKVAKLADINVKELKRLNPGYRKHTTHPTAAGPKTLLIPSENAEILKENLSNDKTKDEGLAELLKPKAKVKSKAKVIAKKVTKTVAKTPNLTKGKVVAKKSPAKNKKTPKAKAVKKATKVASAAGAKARSGTTKAKKKVMANRTNAKKLAKVTKGIKTIKKTGIAKAKSKRILAHGKSGSKKA
jgi:hypothetical protein